MSDVVCGYALTSTNYTDNKWKTEAAHGCQRYPRF